MANTLTRKVMKHCTQSVVHAHHLQQSREFSRFALPRTKEIKLLPPPGSATPHFTARVYSSLNKPPTGLVGWYLRMLETRPIRTKSITAAIIYAAADVSSQILINEARDNYDLLRTMRMAGYGLVILGPSLHFWYNFVSRMFPNRDIISTVKKIVLGQASYGPAMTSIFFSINAALQGESGSEIIARLRRDVFATILNGLMYWPACDFVTFKFIPVQLQPLVVNTFSYLWTIYLTYMASLEKASSS